jgi:Peptidase MA superfamily
VDTPPRSRRLILSAALLALALALLALALRPQAAGAPALARPTATVAAATLALTPMPPPPSPTSTPAPTPTPQIALASTAGPLTITFGLRGQVGGSATEALLWYDTTAGHAIRRISLGGAQAISASVTITPAHEGLTVTEKLSDGLDFWWAIRDGSDIVTRRAGSIALPPQLAALAQTAPITAPAESARVERATPHFRLLAPPGTAAARDLGRLADVAEASFAQAASVITATQPISIPVYLVPRVFWQGGVAYGDGGIVITYLDRNYAGVESWPYFVHEVTHALSAAILPRGAEIGGLLGEGVAVYATGGHYGLEPIDAWAAALVDSKSYVPLCRLRYDFYAAQHEVAYEEGASFTSYLIRTYGLAAFRRIYAAQRPQRGDQRTDVAMFCAADNRRAVPSTGKTASQIEQDWLAYLKTVHPTDEQRRAWELTVRFFDIMRRYQEALDPPARDLPPPPNTWDRTTAAQYLNAATGRRAAALESMLGAVQPAIQRGDPAHAQALLGAIETSLDAAGTPNTPLARDYDAIAGLVETQARALRLGDADALGRTLAAPGIPASFPFTTDDLLYDLRFTLMQLDVRGDSATGIVQADGASLDGRRRDRALYVVRFTRAAGGWRLAAWSAYTPTIDRPPSR